MKRKAFLWIQALLCISLCLVLSLSVILVSSKNAVQGAEQIYSAETFRSIFLSALPLMLAAACMTVLGLVLNIHGGSHIRADAEYRRNDLLLNGSLPEEVSKEHSLQKKFRICGIIFSCLCLIPVVIFTVRSFLEETFSEGSVLCLLLRILPWIIIGFTVLSFMEHLREKSLLRETVFLSSLAASDTGSVAKNRPASAASCRGRILTGIRAGLIVLAAALVIAGFFNGSIADVFNKAIRICAECIGLG